MSARYTVWCRPDGETEEDGARFNAGSARGAAEKWVAAEDNGAAAVGSVGPVEATVRSPDGKVRTYLVYGEMVCTYNARLVVHDPTAVLIEKLAAHWRVKADGNPGYGQDVRETMRECADDLLALLVPEA